MKISLIYLLIICKNPQKCRQKTQNEIPCEKLLIWATFPTLGKKCIPSSRKWLTIRPISLPKRLAKKRTQIPSIRRICNSTTCESKFIGGFSRKMRTSNCDVLSFSSCFIFISFYFILRISSHRFLLNFSVNFSRSFKNIPIKL